jgi:hypothetical protein
MYVQYQSQPILKHRDSSIYKERLWSEAFILKEQFRKVQITHPTEFFAGEKTNEPISQAATGPDGINIEAAKLEGVQVEEHWEWFEINKQGQVIIHDKLELGTVGGGVEDDNGQEPDPCLTMDNQMTNITHHQDTPSKVPKAVRMRHGNDDGHGTTMDTATMDMATKWRMVTPVTTCVFFLLLAVSWQPNGE